MKQVVIIGQHVAETHDALIKAVHATKKAGVIVAVIAGEGFDEINQKLEKHIQTLEASQTLKKNLPKLEVPLFKTVVDTKHHQPPHQIRRRNGR